MAQADPWTTEGSQTRAAPGTPGNSVYKQTVLAATAQGGEASRPTGKGRAAGDSTDKSTVREQAAARAESLDKALASITEGGDPSLKTYLSNELAKAKQAAQDPRANGGQVRLSRCRGAQAATEDGQPHRTASQIGRADQGLCRLTQDGLEEARSESAAKQSKKTQTIELNYEELMHIAWEDVEAFRGSHQPGGDLRGGPVRRKLPGGAVIAEGDPLGGEAFHREAQRTLTVLGDKAIQMRRRQQQQPLQHLQSGGLFTNPDGCGLHSSGATRQPTPQSGGCADERHVWGYSSQRAYPLLPFLFCCSSLPPSFRSFGLCLRSFGVPSFRWQLA